MTLRHRARLSPSSLIARRAPRRQPPTALAASPSQTMLRRRADRSGGHVRRPPATAPTGPAQPASRPAASACPGPARSRSSSTATDGRLGRRGLRRRPAARSPPTPRPTRRRSPSATPPAARSTCRPAGAPATPPPCPPRSSSPRSEPRALEEAKANPPQLVSVITPTQAQQGRAARARPRHDRARRQGDASASSSTAQDDEQALRKAGFRWRVLVPDLVEAEPRRSAPPTAASPPRVARSDFPSGRDTYRTLADYNAELKELAAAEPQPRPAVHAAEQDVDGQGRPRHRDHRERQPQRRQAGVR